jgi:N-acetylglucosaminyldiphosphoundecaprenol N-acetyl-beta-D-mannosaminyltransferase
MRQSILGCAVDNLSMSETLDRVADQIATGKPHQHVAINVDKIVKASRDPELARIIGACDLINVDGMPLVWASRLLGEPLKERVAGVDLFFALLERAALRGWRVYFLGAKADVVAEVVSRAVQRHPALQVAGHRDGYWTAEQETAVVDQIRDSRADLLFVAISSPFKEAFLARHQQAMGIPFAMGVGGTFDVAAGVVKRAPVWMQRSGLEWFFRFLQEPRRMFKRYFVDDMAFFVLLAKALRHRVLHGRQHAAAATAAGASTAPLSWPSTNELPLVDR